MLIAVRARIERYSPEEAVASGGLIVDLRCEDVRQRLGIVPGSVHVPRSVLEWRADPGSGYSNPALVGRRLILMCEHGFSSSLAAATLRDIGVDAADLAGGFTQWLADGLPVLAAPDPDGGLPGMGGPQGVTLP